MADRQRRRGASSCHGGSKSKNGRPPTENWQPAVPQWEKKFCNEVGSVPWWRIVETRKVMRYYPNVVEWNDFAVEEAFNREESRFWAAINGLPCDISLPDPDIYIDEIDWNSDDADPELLLDLDRECLGSEEEETDGNLGLNTNILFLMNQPVPRTGWGTDEEEDPPRTANNTPDQVVPCARWGAEEDLTRTAYNTLSGPGLEGNGGENHINESEHSRSTRTGGNLGTWNSNRPKGGGAGGYTSRRFRKSRLQSDNNGQRTGKVWKKMNFGHYHQVMEPNPLVPKQWSSINTCGPMSYNKSDREGRFRDYEKTVSLQ